MLAADGLLCILATAVQHSQEHGSSYPRIIFFFFLCLPTIRWQCLMPCLGCILAFGQSRKTGGKTGREERKRAAP